MTDLLEAAHILQYASSRSNAATNGLLLRADIHTLFDLDLLRIDCSGRTPLVRIAPDAAIDPMYARLDERPLEGSISRAHRRALLTREGRRATAARST